MAPLFYDLEIEQINFSSPSRLYRSETIETLWKREENQSKSAGKCQNIRWNLKNPREFSIIRVFAELSISRFDCRLDFKASLSVYYCGSVKVYSSRSNSFLNEIDLELKSNTELRKWKTFEWCFSAFGRKVKNMDSRFDLETFQRPAVSRALEHREGWRVCMTYHSWQYFISCFFLILCFVSFILETLRSGNRSNSF